jgi:hypothetical protein
VKELLERERELAAVEELLGRRSGVLIVEVGVGIGKTSLVEAACRRAQELGYAISNARGSELEADFAFGIVRQLFERRLASAGADERAALLAGPAAAVKPLLLGKSAEASAGDMSFAVLHGLYWLAANLSAARPLLLAIDDAHWADEPSLRWLTYLTRRLDGLTLVDVDEALAARLEGELVICGLHDARRASRVKPVLERHGAPSFAASHAEALAARGMAMVLSRLIRPLFRWVDAVDAIERGLAELGIRDALEASLAGPPAHKGTG